MLPQAKTALIESAILRQAKADLMNMMRAWFKHNRSDIQRQLRALAQPAFVLLAVCLVLAELLACIIDCQLAISFLADQPVQRYVAAPHVDAVAFSSPAMFTAEAIAVPADPNCFQISSSPSPTPLAPLSPLHDLILAALPVLAGFVLFQRMYALPPALLLARSTTPPTPPPRHFPA